ncbi:MAG TPA: aspartate-semialdehyde dehydrogenase, partial [Planctomycetes bacterium]|nr:aspartate-semialdehyde dehydrogenase [Planctomycetota bacterium]
MSAPRIAIVGATGAVGHEFLRVLAEREFSMGSIKLLASPRSAGQKLTFRGEQHVVQALADDSFGDVDVVFFSAGGEISRKFAPKAVDAGAVVIDNSSAFRMQHDVPLVVPEVNRAALAGHQGIIANPNCSTIILVLALQPLHQAVGLRSVVVSTYQAASGAGQRAMDELHRATRAVLAGEQPPKPDALAQSLAFNLFPHVDVFMPDGFTREEDKMLFEVQKILALPELKALGRKALEKNPLIVESRASKVSADDVALVVYTSGTTGRPKGVPLSHKNVLSQLKSGDMLIDDISGEDITISFLPMAHVAEHVPGFFGRLNTGMRTAFATNYDTLLDELLEVRPTYF